MAKPRRHYQPCPDCNFPMLRLDGKLQCASKYLNRCLGMKRITEVRQDGDRICLIFEDGHELPQLCGCCGKPLVIKDIDKLNKDYRKRRLVSFSDAREGTSYNDTWPVVILELSGIGDIPGIAWESVAQMRHPPDCPARRQRRARPDAGAKTKRRRKRRR